MKPRWFIAIAASAAVAAAALWGQAASTEADSPQSRAPAGGATAPEIRGQGSSDRAAAAEVAQPASPYAARLSEAMQTISRTTLPEPGYRAPVDAPGCDDPPPPFDAEAEKAAVAEFFERGVNPRLRECLHGEPLKGEVNVSFVFVRDEYGAWTVARQAEQLERAGLDEASAISMIDSTLPPQFDHVVSDCLGEVTADLALPELERLERADYYRVYWRWRFSHS